MIPTEYKEINEAIDVFLLAIKNILGDSFVGMYLYGSLALGDFDPEHSDIDFIVITENPVTEPQFNELFKIHEDFKRSSSLLAQKIEAAYIPKIALKHATLDKYPQIEKDRALQLEPLEIGWPMQAYTFREHGIIIAGPNPQELMDPVPIKDLHNAAIAITSMWQQDCKNDSWLEWLQECQNQAFVVITLCRLLYLFETSKLASKQAAFAWAQNTLMPRWHKFIQDSWDNRFRENNISEQTIADTVDFIKYTAKSLGT